MNRLRHIFPSLREVRPEVVLEAPDWSVDDAGALNAFLTTNTGKKLLGRMRYDVTCIVLDPRDMDSDMRDQWRAIAHVISGVESMANTEYWKLRDKEYLEREYLSEGTGFGGE